MTCHFVESGESQSVLYEKLLLLKILSKTFFIEIDGYTPFFMYFTSNYLPVRFHIPT